MKKLYAVLPLLLLFACKKSVDLSKADYFAFGTSYGFCVGNCANFYCIKDGKIYPDDMNRYDGSHLLFKTDPLPDEKYLFAKQLVDNFPPYLEKQANKTFGCPDCTDQGSINIEYKLNGQVKYWHIDTFVDNQPPEIRAYISALRDVLSKL